MRTAVKSCSSYSVTVDYDQTTESLIAQGRYDSVSPPDLGEQHIHSFHREYQLSGVKRITMSLFAFDFPKGVERVNASYAQTLVHRCRHRMALHKELLALGALLPDLQREFPIVTTQAWIEVPSPVRVIPDDSLRTLVLTDNDVHGRSLWGKPLASGYTPQWDEIWRFATVRLCPETELVLRSRKAT